MDKKQQNMADQTHSLEENLLNQRDASIPEGMTQETVIGQAPAVDWPKYRDAFTEGRDPGSIPVYLNENSPITGASSSFSRIPEPHKYTLIEACEDGNVSEIKYLSDRMTPEQINAVDAKGFTALFRAAQKDPEKLEAILTLLLSNGAKIIPPPPPDNYGWSPSQEGITYDKDEQLMRQMFQYYLNEDGIYVPWATDNDIKILVWGEDEAEGDSWTEFATKGSIDKTPLFRAARKGLHLVVRRMLDDGMPDNGIPGENQQTPLLLATYKCHSEVIRELLKKRISKGNEEKGPDIQKAFGLAISTLDVATIRSFLDFSDKAKLELPAGSGGDIVNWVKERETPYVTHDIIKHLLRLKKFKHKEKVDTQLNTLLARPSSGPLHWAVYAGEPAVVLSLLKSGRFDRTETEQAEAMAKSIVENFETRPISRSRITETNQKSGAGAKSSESHQGDRSIVTSLEDNKKDQQADDEMRNRYCTTLEIFRFSGMLLNSAEFKPLGSQRKYGNPKTRIPDFKLTLFKASIVDFYGVPDDFGSFSSPRTYLRQSFHVHEVIYGEGPGSLMEKALNILTKGEKVFECKESHRQLRWIHLPANNVRKSTELS